MATVAHRDVEKRDREIRDIKAAIDIALGKDTSVLVFKTLKLVYRIDEYEIVSNHSRFEEAMINMLGLSVHSILERQIS